MGYTCNFTAMLGIILCSTIWTAYASTTRNDTDKGVSVNVTNFKSTTQLIAAINVTVTPSADRAIISHLAPNNNEEEAEQTTVEVQTSSTETPGDPLPIEIIIGIAGGVVLTCMVLAVIFVVILRRSCQKEPQPLYNPDNFESFRLMRSSANLLAISEPPRAIEGRARPRAGSLQLSHPPDDTTIHDFQYSVMETCRQINGLEKLGCLPEYMELIDGPDGVYLELTVEYDIKPEVEEYIPYAERLEQMNLKNERD